VEIDDNKVTNIIGYGCSRGKQWGIEEATSPKRVVMSVIKVRKGDLPTVSVKTDKRMPKERIRDVMKMLARLEVEAPIHMGQIIVKDIFGLGVNIIATREVKVKP
jgi:CxxC motif-containing protein